MYRRGSWWICQEQRIDSLSTPVENKTRYNVTKEKKRFINFIVKIRESNKGVIRRILQEIENDCRSTTGRNIRKLRLESNAMQLSDIDIEKVPYREVPEGDQWKIDMVNEIIEMKSGRMEVTNFALGEINDICKFLCNCWWYVLLYTI